MTELRNQFVAERNRLTGRKNQFYRFCRILLGGAVLVAVVTGGIWLFELYFVAMGVGQ